MSYQRAIIPPTQRINELLEALKQEFETVTNEASLYRMHKDDFDHKCMSFCFSSFSFANCWVLFVGGGRCQLVRVMPNGVDDCVGPPKAIVHRVFYFLVTICLPCTLAQSPVSKDDADQCSGW
ncbi:hypothetical protein V1525DRAFT_208384 [Lipomyces kononenkoae]|uniref:Uncharacterized protein n=1 Tax=Lipomyces kononenkoae TaxID=34357 RepID=A0ACC3TA88_LIPKO